MGNTMVEISAVTGYARIYCSTLLKKLKGSRFCRAVAGRKDRSGLYRQRTSAWRRP
jgi:hypothetical protein